MLEMEKNESASGSSFHHFLLSGVFHPFVSDFGFRASSFSP
jgi:hypothetical protein